MTLRARGEEPEKSKPKGWAVPTPTGFEEQAPETVEEALEQIRGAGGQSAIDAVELTMAAVLASDKFLETGEETDGKVFFALVEKLGKLDPKNLHTILASGVMAMAEVRRNYREDN